MLTDFLGDIFGDLMFRGIKKACEWLRDYSTVHPRGAAAAKAFLLILLAAAAAGWFVFGAYLGWKAEDPVQMWLFVCAASLLLLLYAFLVLRRVFRRHRQRKERMYDPRYQK